MKGSVAGLVSLGLCLAAGVGGSLGAAALGSPDLSMAILAFSSGLLGGLLAPQMRLTSGPS